MVENVGISLPKDFAPVIPCFDFLTRDKTLPADSAAREALAAAGYWLKEGRSVALSIPRADSATLETAVAYLQRLREDALRGIVRAAWFSSGRMKARPQMVVFGKPGAMAGICNASQARVVLVRTNRDLDAGRFITLDDRFGSAQPFQILLCAASEESVALIDALHACTAPMCFIIDAGIAGNSEGLVPLLDSLVLYFPDTPKLLLMAAGDSGLLEAIPSSIREHFLHWNQRNQTGLAADDRTPKPWQFTFVESPDSYLAGRLQGLLKEIGQLKQRLSRLGAGERQILLQPFVTVMNHLIHLACPLAELDEALIRHRRRNPQTVRTLDEWLGISGSSAAPHAAVKTSVESLRDSLAVLLQTLRKSSTGKQQLVRLLARQEGDRAVIVVDTQPQVEAVKDTLDGVECRVADVLSVDSLKAYPHPINTLIPLLHWQPDRYWLLARAQNVLLPVYAFETEALRRRLQPVIESALVQPCNTTAWQAWWMKPLKEWDLEKGSAQDVMTVRKDIVARGKYAAPAEEAATPLSEPWCLDILFEEDVSAMQGRRASRREVMGDASIALMRIFLTSRNQPWIVSPDSPVDVLRKQTVETICASEVSEGDTVLRFPDDDRRGTLKTLLVLLGTPLSTVHQLAGWADRWHEWVRLASKTPNAIRLGLERQNLPVSDAILYRWVVGVGMGPWQEAVITMLAQLSSHPEAQKMSGACWQALEKLMNLTDQLGKQLQSALKATQRGETLVRIGSNDLDIGTFRHLVDLTEVERVEAPFAPGADAARLSLVEAISDVCAKHEDSLVFTPRAKRSAEKAGFLQIEKVVTCFHLLATELVRAYRQEKNLQDALDVLRGEQFEFVGDTADVTKGLSNDYKVKYAGRNWDIGAHIRIGRSRNPAHCFRIHFAYDETNRKLLIFHAGNHLPVKDS